MRFAEVGETLGVELGVKSGQGVGLDLGWGLTCLIGVFFDGILDVGLLVLRVGAVCLEELAEARGAEGGAIALKRLVWFLGSSSSSRSALLRFTDAATVETGPNFALALGVGAESAMPIILNFAAGTSSLPSPINFISFTLCTKSSRCLYTTELNLTSLCAFLTLFRILSTASLSCVSDSVGR
jgi:hypothetical protein